MIAGRRTARVRKGCRRGQVEWGMGMGREEAGSGSGRTRPRPVRSSPAMDGFREELLNEVRGVWQLFEERVCAHGDSDDPIDHTGAGKDRGTLPRTPIRGGRAATRPTSSGPHRGPGGGVGGFRGMVCGGEGEEGMGASFRSDVGQQSVFGIRWAPTVGFGGRWVCSSNRRRLRSTGERTTGGVC